MRTGRIYKIISGQGDECYVGSTFQLVSHRWRDHKDMYKQYKKCKTHNTSSFDLFDKYGVDNCAIILIKEYEVCDRTHMEAYEQLWINKLNCINKYNPFYIKKLSDKQYCEQNKDKLKEYREQNKDKIKEWREQNKDKMKEYNKQWHEQNKDKIKEWREQNKDKIRQKEKQYREQNKDKINQRQRERRAAKKAASIES